MDYNNDDTAPGIEGSNNAMDGRDHALSFPRNGGNKSSLVQIMAYYREAVACVFVPLYF